MVRRPPARLADFHFNYPYDYVEKMVGLMEASGFRVWPAAGGLEDQDPLMIEDIETLLALRSRIEWEEKHPDGEDEDDESTAPDDEIKPEVLG